MQNLLRDVLTSHFIKPGFTCLSIQDEFEVVNAGRKALIHASTLGQCVHSEALIPLLTSDHWSLS